MTPETRVKNECIAYLQKSGLFYLRINSGKVKVKGGFMQLAPVGTADLICWPAGRTLWIELKAPGQKTAKDRAIKQLEFRDKVLGAGHEHAICMSADDVIAAVKDCAK